MEKAEKKNYKEIITSWQDHMKKAGRLRLANYPLLARRIYSMEFLNNYVIL